MNNQFNILIIFFCITCGACKNNCRIHDFTFIKLGQAEFIDPAGNYSAGATFYLNVSLCEDSMVVKINAYDEFDTTNTRTPDVYKLHLPEGTKQIVHNFIAYANLQGNGLIDNAKFSKPVFYNGGTYVLCYYDADQKEHYYFYNLTNLSSTTSMMHDELIQIFYNPEELIGNERVIKINTDSIVLALQDKVGMEMIMFPPKIEPPPIKD